MQLKIKQKLNIIIPISVVDALNIFFQLKICNLFQSNKLIITLNLSQLNSHYNF